MRFVEGDTGGGAVVRMETGMEERTKRRRGLVLSKSLGQPRLVWCWGSHKQV